jgi:hypothetical protein
MDSNASTHMNILRYFIVLTCSCNMFCIWHMNFQELRPLIPNSFHFCPTSKFSSKLCRTFDRVKSTRLMMAFFCLGHTNRILYTLNTSHGHLRCVTTYNTQVPHTYAPRKMPRTILGWNIRITNLDPDLASAKHFSATQTLWKI